MKILRSRDAQCNSVESIILGPSLVKCGNRMYCMYSNFVGSGEQTTEVVNGEVNEQEEKDETATQTATTEPVNGVQQEDAGEHIK